MANRDTKLLIKKVLYSLGVGVYRAPHRSEVWSNPPSDRRHSKIIPDATYSPWLNDIQFQRVYAAVQRHTLVEKPRLYELWSLAKQASKVDGDILEVGVWRGGSGAVLAEAARTAPDKIVYLADTFAGVVKAGGKDTRYKGGEHADTSAALVDSLFTSMGIENQEILEGTFPEETGARIRGTLALVHCDVDVYLSAKDIFDWCLPRLTVGSVLVFDDYGFSGCEGVTALVEELSTRRDFLFVHNLNGHGILTKIS